MAPWRLSTRLGRLACSAAMLTILIATVTSGDSASARPGPLGGGVTLLPNGWMIAPTGQHLQIGDLPLAMVESPDGHALRPPFEQELKQG